MLLPLILRRGLCPLLFAMLAACQTPPTATPPKAAAVEQRQAALKTLGFVPKDDHWELSLGVKLLFDTDVDTLTPEGRDALQSMARLLVEVGIDRIRVEGHTDNVGSARYNQQLSMRRADTVAGELVRSGIRGEAIERIGVGYDKPVADNASAAGRAQNRRVVITVRTD